MSKNNEEFFNGSHFAVIGHSAAKKFPLLTYNGLKSMNKTVFPIDSSCPNINGDKCYTSLAELPVQVDRAILELPQAETNRWFDQVLAAGIKHVWIHMGCDTPEAHALALEHNVNLRTGTCAVMYVRPGFSYHGIHRGIMKLTNKY